MEENEYIDVDNDMQNQLNKVNDLDKKKENICDSYIFVFSFFLIESLISFGGFYLFYIFKIGDKNNTIYQIIEFSLLCILIVFYVLFGITFVFIFDHNYRKINNFIQFILISLFKICFFTFVYLINVLSGENRIDYPHFEARAYWKISMCILYLAFIFYQYFKKDKYSEKLSLFIIMAVASLLIFFFLTYFTQSKGDSWDRIWIHILFMFLEIYFSLITIFMQKSEENEKKLENVLREKMLDWKINEIDFFRYFIGLAPYIYIAIKKKFNKSRFCQKFFRNFSF